MNKGSRFEYVEQVHRLGMLSFFCKKQPIDERKFFMQFRTDLRGGIQRGAIQVTVFQTSGEDNSDRKAFQAAGRLDEADTSTSARQK